MSLIEWNVCTVVFNAIQENSFSLYRAIRSNGDTESAVPTKRYEFASAKKASKKKSKIYGMVYGMLVPQLIIKAARVHWLKVILTRVIAIYVVLIDQQKKIINLAFLNYVNGLSTYTTPHYYSRINRNFFIIV